MQMGMIGLGRMGANMVRRPTRGATCWGITASNGNVVREVAGVSREFFDYVARGVPDGPDDGTVAPWRRDRFAAVRSADRAIND